MFVNEKHDNERRRSFPFRKMDYLLRYPYLQGNRRHAG